METTASYDFATDGRYFDVMAQADVNQLRLLADRQSLAALAMTQLMRQRMAVTSETSYETAEQADRVRNLAGSAGQVTIQGMSQGFETTANGLGNGMWEVVAGVAGQQAVPAESHSFV